MEDVKYKDYIIQFRLYDGTTRNVPILIPLGEPFRYEDFTPEQLEALRGPQGNPFTYDDFTPEQLEALRGPAFTFDDFTPEQLQKLTGKSAYDYATEAGFLGTEKDFAEKLAAGTVLYTKQTLTEEQKAQARENIGISVSEPAEDDIPVIFYSKALPQTKDEVIMPFRYASKTKTVTGYCKTNAQGNLSMSYPKKNQTTKIYADAECTEKLKIDFRGWGKQNKFCLKANWIDITHARNIVSARIWADMVKSRGNYEELPELLRTSPNQGAVDGFPVKVYAAGVYQGRYTLNIPKDAWMTNMDDSLDNHCILCGEDGDWSGKSSFRVAPVIDGTDWTDEIHDTVPASIRTRWEEVVNFVNSSADDVFKSDLQNYFDVLSLMDYYLFGLAACHSDGFAKNQLYMTYDGRKWVASAYDMDGTWGLVWDGESFNVTNRDDYLGETANLLYWRLSQLFKSELKERWVELRSDVLNESNILYKFEEFINVCPPHIVAEDYAEATGGGAFTGIPSVTTNNIQQIRQYVADRLAWCDLKFGIDSGTGSGTAYTNQIPISTDWDGNVFNETGYKTGVFTSGDGTVDYPDAASCATGFIPCKVGDIIRMQNIEYNATTNRAALFFYTEDKTLIGVTKGNSGWYMDTVFTGIKDDNGNYILLNIVDIANITTGCAFVRINAQSITENSIVTINEAIG